MHLKETCWLRIIPNELRISLTLFCHYIASYSLICLPQEGWEGSFLAVCLSIVQQKSQNLQCKTWLNEWIYELVPLKQDLSGVVENVTFLNSFPGTDSWASTRLAWKITMSVTKSKGGNVPDAVSLLANSEIPRASVNHTEKVDGVLAWCKSNFGFCHTFNGKTAVIFAPT